MVKSIKEILSGKWKILFGTHVLVKFSEIVYTKNSKIFHFINMKLNIKIVVILF